MKLSYPLLITGLLVQLINAPLFAAPIRIKSRDQIKEITFRGRTLQCLKRQKSSSRIIPGKRSGRFFIMYKAAELKRIRGKLRLAHGPERRKLQRKLIILKNLQKGARAACTQAHGGVPWNSWEHLHDFTGLPMTEDGWTDLLAMYQHPDYYEDSRIIYVSSSDGDDATGIWYTPPAAGFDPANPVGPIQPFKTLAAAYNHLRDGYPDMMLLKRGDSWNEYFSHTSVGSWTKSGRSPVERMVLATYGAAAPRPTLLTGTGDGLASGKANNLIVAGIRFFAHTWESATPDRSVDILGAAKDQLHEDCLYERQNSTRVQGFPESERHNRIAFRRCIWIEGLPGSLVAKIYAENTKDLLLEDNTFYSPVEKNRHLYLSPDGNADDSTLRGVIVRGNIFFTSQRTGLSARAGGLIENNLIVRNDLILFGGAGGSEDSIQSGIIRNNVFTQATPNGAEHPNGDGEWGVSLQNIDGGLVSGNIWTDPTNLGTGSYAIIVKGDTNVNIAKNIDIHDNIVYGWGGPGFGRALRIEPELDPVGHPRLVVENVKVRNNDFQMVNGSGEILQHSSSLGFEGISYQNNRYYSPDAQTGWFFQGDLPAWTAASGETGAIGVPIAYPHPERNLTTYNASVGGSASVEAFMAEAILQSRAYWRPEYTAAAVNAYIREGFGMPAGGVD